MATSINSMKSVLRAHVRPVNGVSSPDPDVDDGVTVLQQAHGVLVLVNASHNVGVNPDITQSALDAVETLLAMGIRSIMEGHEHLLRGARLQ